MLRITIPSTGSSTINFSSFENLDLPKPPNGIDDEGDDTLVLLFEDEEDAIHYADDLKDISSDMDGANPQAKLAVNDIIVAIEQDEFVQGYLR